MLNTLNLSHAYDGKLNFNFPNINCENGQTLLVLGQSGVGKTTLLHILAGILSPNQGSVIIEGIDIYKLSSNKLDTFRGQNIGLVFQKPHFVQSISAIDNLILAQKMADKAIDKTYANELLEKLNLGHRKNAKTFQMSQGEQQRLSIARSLINKPKVILADEPTSSLDDKNCEEVITLLENHSANVNASLIVVTHDNRLKEFFNNKVELI